VTTNQCKKIREGFGLNQDEFAQALCLSGAQAVSNIETGYRNPGKLVVALLHVLETLPTKRAEELIAVLRAHSSTAKVRKGGRSYASR
jgi:DNA-binding transcriptional regulator YiaG